MQIDHIHEKGTGAFNEDALFLNGRIFGVFDGATSLDGATYEQGVTGGRLASTIACETFKKDDAPLLDLAREANSAICRGMTRRGVDLARKESLWSTSAAVIRLTEETFEWIQTGDSLILAIYEDNSYKVLVDNFDHDLETLLMWKEVAQERKGPILEELREQIIKVRTQMNVTYGVINGEDATEKFLKTGTEKLDGIKHLLLFTDGLFIPSEDPEKDSNFDDFVELFLNGKLSGVRDHVRSLQESDPDCRKYPRFKPHDDIAAVALSF